MQKTSFCDPNLADQQPAFSVSQARKLPEIPSPSSHLQNLLCQYQFEEITPNKKSLRAKRSPGLPRKRRINGFIAFRSFYSKTIKGASHQKELSSKLATVWKNEPHHQIWNCYALQYNATGGEEAFVDWLNRNLGFVNDFEDDKILKTYKNHMLKNVEDVFFETSNDDREKMASN